jgi:hypothetical protein
MWSHWETIRDKHERESQQLSEVHSQTLCALDVPLFLGNQNLVLYVAPLRFFDKIVYCCFVK